MKAAVLVAPGRFEVRDVPMPTVGPQDALIRVSRTGICGTDLHIFRGHYAADRLPLIPGHEFCGTIAEVGFDVRHLAVGQRVVADINIGCGTCYWCRRNEILNCPTMTQLGIGRDGAFAEYVSLPARLVIPAPDTVSDAVLALTEPVSCVVRAARKAQVSFGQSVVILGAGPMGNLHVQMMRLVGAAPIIVADLSPDRCRMALEAGADAAISDPSVLRDQILSMTGGRGADLVIESVGSSRLYATAQTLIRKGGHIAVFGLTSPEEILPINILQTILQENSLKGSVAGMGEDMHDALTLLTYGRFKTAAFTTAIYALGDIQTAFDTFADRPADLKTQITLCRIGVQHGPRMPNPFAPIRRSRVRFLHRRQVARRPPVLRARFSWPFGAGQPDPEMHDRGPERSRLCRPPRLRGSPLGRHFRCGPGQRPATRGRHPAAQAG